MRRIKKKPREGLCCIQRQHPSGGLVGRTVLGLECCGEAESIRNRPTQLDPWQVSPKKMILFLINHNCGLRSSIGSYPTALSIYSGYQVNLSALSKCKSQLCAPFIDRSHAASICASLRGCWIVVVAGADPGIDDFSLGTPAAHHIVNRAQAAWAPSS